MQRLACLFVPLFPLAARLRSEPELAGEALLILSGNGHAARVNAASRAAREAGIRRSMSLAQARALRPKILTRSRDASCEQTAQQALLEIAEALSPRVEDAGEGMVYIDLSGLERHWPREIELANALRNATHRASLPAQVGLASSKLAARIAAKQPRTPTVIEAGREASFLAPLPLGHLLEETQVVGQLEHWGIRSIGEFARLPKHQIASRFGAAGQALHQQARGLDAHPLVPHQPIDTFDEGMELEWPLTTLEPFLFVARAALERLADRMARRGLACTQLALSLQLDPDGIHDRSVTLPAPTRDIKTLLTLTRLDLEASPPNAAIIGFTFRATPDRPREAQLTLFGPAALSPDRLATTMARLFAILGSEAVGTPTPGDKYRPESFSLQPFLPPPPPEVREAPPKSYGLLAIRALRPPIPLEVLINRHPKQVKSLVTEETERRPKINGRVRIASGPWTLEEDWWTEEPIDRDYWDVELAHGAIYRIYRDRLTEDWFADGIYD